MVSIEHQGLAQNFQGFTNSPSEVGFFSSYDSCLALFHQRCFGMWLGSPKLTWQIDSFHIHLRKTLFRGTARGVFVCLWPPSPLFKPFLSKQPTTGSKNDVTIWWTVWPPFEKSWLRPCSDSVKSLWSLTHWLYFGILFLITSATESGNNIFTRKYTVFSVFTQYTHTPKQEKRHIYLCSSSSSRLSSPFISIALILQLRATEMFCSSSSKRITSFFLIFNLWSFSIWLRTDSICCCFPVWKGLQNTSKIINS